MDKWRINGSSIRKGLVTLVILFILSATLWEVRFYKKAAEMKQYNELLNTDNVKLYSINESTITQSAMTLLPIQSHGRLNCTDESCSNLLSTSDLKIFKQCAQHASKHGPIDPGKCKFMNGKDRQPIGLISFPGSGNTWVRGLLQQVTGFCTGSVYCDPDLRRHGFVGENIATGSVLVIKTHRSSFIASKSHSGKSKSNLQQVVFIIRNPYDSIISERNRKLSQHISNNMDYVSSHVQTVGAKYFGELLWDKNSIGGAFQCFPGQIFDGEVTSVWLSLIVCQYLIHTLWTIILLPIITL